MTPCRWYQSFGGRYSSIFMVESTSVSHLRRPHLDTEEGTLMLTLDRKNCTSDTITQNFKYNWIGVTSCNSTCLLTFPAGGDVRRWRCTQNSVTSWRAFDAEEQMSSSTCPPIELWNNFCHCLIQNSPFDAIHSFTFIPGTTVTSLHVKHARITAQNTQ